MIIVYSTCHDYDMIFFLRLAYTPICFKAYCVNNLSDFFKICL